jgi:hypothetical protein
MDPIKIVFRLKAEPPFTIFKGADQYEHESAAYSPPQALLIPSHFKKPNPTTADISRSIS